MFENAQQARDWLKELGYPVLETLVDSRPQLKHSAAKHISEWAPLVKIETPDHASLHIYWVAFKQTCNSRDLRYVVDAYLKKYPQVLALFIGSYYRQGKWVSLLMCPEPRADHWYHACLMKKLAPDNERLIKALQYNPAEPVETLWRRVYHILRGEPMNTRVEQAFESFITELETIRAEIDSEIEQALQRKEYNRMGTLAQKAGQLCELIEKVQLLRAGITPPAPAVESVRRARGAEDATHQKAYTLPLLQALVDLDGEASREDVLKRVHELMKDKLKPADYEELPSGKGIRWQTKVAWLRFELRKQGYLRADTSKGIWAITEQGRQYLEQLKRRSKTAQGTQTQA